LNDTVCLWIASRVQVSALFKLHMIGPVNVRRRINLARDLEG
jgi:hypothetical protein